MPGPTIAAITGACTGGGAGIAACCDMRIGDRVHQIRFPDRAHARQLPVDVDHQQACGLIGPARVKDLLFTARLIGADEAASAGLLSEVVADLPALQQPVDALAVSIAGNAPLTLSATKQALARLRRQLAPDEGEDIILSCYASSDFREGLDAFLNKRPPQWRGE